MAQIGTLTEAQLRYVIRRYLDGWGLAAIASRLKGIGRTTVRAHLCAAGIAIREPGGYRKMVPRLPPPFEPRPKKAKSVQPPKAPPGPRVVAWHKPIRPGWMIHGEVIYGPKRRAS